MTEACTHADRKETGNPAPRQPYSRAETARHVTHLRQARAGGSGEQSHARKVGIPRSTYRYWTARRRQIKAAGVP